jgi:hypothetical protein
MLSFFPLFSFFLFLNLEKTMSTNFVPLFDKMGTQPGNNHASAKGGSTAKSGLWKGEVGHMKLISNAPDEDFQTGRTKAPVIQIETPQSISILCDSKDRLQKEINLNPFSFSISLNSNLYRSRFSKVTKCCIPKPPNITINNNRLCFFEGADVLNEIIIPPGFYNTTSIGNIIQSLCTAQSALTGGNNTFTCVFNPQTRTFNLSSTAIFYISTNCNFIQRGANFIPFHAFDDTLPAVNVANVGQLNFNSAESSLLYTKYMYLCSSSLNNYSFAVSKSSDTTLNEDIIAIVDITSMYAGDDWDVGRPFAGGFMSVFTTDAPNISLRNPQRALSPEMDVYCLDEYAIDFDECFDLSYPGGPVYPPNQAGVAFWMEVTF